MSRAFAALAAAFATLAFAGPQRPTSARGSVNVDDGPVADEAAWHSEPRLVVTRAGAVLDARVRVLDRTATGYAKPRTRSQVVTWCSEPCGGRVWRFADVFVRRNRDTR